MPREYFNAYHSYLDSMRRLSDAEVGRLFRALLKYSMTGTLDDLPGNERFVLDGMTAQIDRDSKKYAEKCEKNRRNGAIGGRQANESERKQTQANATQTPPKEKTKEKEKEKEQEKEHTPHIPPERVAADKPPIRRRFAPPTVEEVREYCAERKNHVDAEAFVAHYQSNGWMVGRTKMKDWRAAVRTWEKNDYGKKLGESKRDDDKFFL